MLTINNFNAFVTSRIESIADEAYRLCPQNLNEKSETIIATGLWALATTTLFAVLHTDQITPPVVRDEALKLMEEIADQFGQWALTRDIGDGPESNAERLDEYVAAMASRVFQNGLKGKDFLRCASEGVPDFLAMLTNEVIGPSLMIPALRAMHSPFAERKAIIGAWRDVNS